jgi:hypothetical protein
MTIANIRSPWCLTATMLAALSMAGVGLAQQQGQQQPGDRDDDRLERHREATEDAADTLDIDRTDRTTQHDRSQGEQSSTAWLGVVIVPTDDNEGVEIADVYPSGPAARANFEAGDVLLSIDGQRVTDPEQVSRLMRQHRPDSQVAVTLQRGEQQVKANVRLADRTEFLGDVPDSNRSNQPALDQRQMRNYRGEYPEHSLMLEQHRHLANQHQRLEELLRTIDQRLDKLEQEISQIRGAVISDSDGNSPRPARPAEQ